MGQSVSRYRLGRFDGDLRTHSSHSLRPFEFTEQKMGKCEFVTAEAILTERPFRRLTRHSVSVNVTVPFRQSAQRQQWNIVANENQRSDLFLAISLLHLPHFLLYHLRVSANAKHIEFERK